jgi:expansin (peptidoglycan-binding protein)
MKPSDLLGVSLGLCAVWLVLSCSSSGSASKTDATSSSGNPSPPVVTTVAFGALHTGVATFYTTADGSGACLYDKNTADTNIAALDVADWNGSAWCGACADVTLATDAGSPPTVRVRIVDECPDCSAGQLDLHPAAFAQLAPTSEGRVPITWTFVACDVTGPVAYKYKDGSNAYWTAVQVQNSRLPIAKFESSADGMTWVEAARQDYNYFLNASGFGTGMVHVRITAEDGQMLEDTLPPVQALLVTTGQAQFQ